MNSSKIIIIAVLGLYLGLSLCAHGEAANGSCLENLTKTGKNKFAREGKSPRPQFLQAHGLHSEFEHRPETLLISPGSTEPGFDQVTYDALKFFIDHSKNPIILLPDLTILQAFKGKEGIRGEIYKLLTRKKVTIQSALDESGYLLVNHPWMRDLAPIKVFNQQTQQYELVFFQHSANIPLSKAEKKSGQRNFTDLQRHIANVLGISHIKEPNLYLEGGNLLSDGQGTLFLSTKVLEANPGVTKDMITQELIQLNLGTNIIWLPQLPKAFESTGHVDLFMRFIDHQTVIVPSTDNNPKLKAAFNKIAEELEKNGYSTQRIPIDGTVINGKSGTRSIRSPLNALEIGNRILIPTFGNDYDELQKQFFENLGYSVETTSGETLESGGSVHCLIYTY